MANPSLLALAQMANKAYLKADGQQQSGSLVQGDYQAQWRLLGGGSSIGKQGFKGCIFWAHDGSHTIVAFGGTKLSSWEDIKADLRIGCGWPPKQVEAAITLVETSENLTQGDLYIVGHSLGGALAQYVGTKMEKPFASFNAPGMRAQAEGQFDCKPQGINFRMKNDPISGPEWGKHLGSVVELDPDGTVGIKSAHSMTTVIDYITKFKEVREMEPLGVRLPTLPPPAVIAPARRGSGP